MRIYIHFVTKYTNSQGINAKIILNWKNKNHKIFDPFNENFILIVRILLRTGISSLYSIVGGFFPIEIIKTDLKHNLN